ncbi:MAG: hypothetical protein RLZZ226_1727, partial [Pseudomonadota bacterium]
MKLRRLSYRLLLWVALGLLPATSQGQSVVGTPGDSDLAGIREKIKTIRESRDSLESRRQELTEQLSVIERRYGRLARNRNELENQVK